MATRATIAIARMTGRWERSAFDRAGLATAVAVTMIPSRQTSTDVGAKEGRISRGGVWRRGGVGGEGKGCECRREKEGGHTKGGFEHGLSCEGDGMFGLSRRSLHHTACGPREGKIQSLGPGRPPPPCFCAKSSFQQS